MSVHYLSACLPEHLSTIRISSVLFLKYKIPGTIKPENDHVYMLFCHDRGVDLPGRAIAIPVQNRRI